MYKKYQARAEIVIFLLHYTKFSGILHALFILLFNLTVKVVNGEGNKLLLLLLFIIPFICVF